MPEPEIRADVVSTVDGSIFDESYYEHDCGIPYERNDHWMAFFGAIADHVVSDLHPRSRLDAAARWDSSSSSSTSAESTRTGSTSRSTRSRKVPEPVADRCRVGSLVEPIDGTYDLVTCIEVLEHMAPDEAARPSPTSALSTDRVLFSSSPLDYAEATHVNVRPPEAWAADFATHGFFRNLDYDATYLTPWAVLYERRSDDPGDIVRAYERVQSRMEAEIRQLRENALRDVARARCPAVPRAGATQGSRGARTSVEDLQANCSRCATPSSDSRPSSAKRGTDADYLALLAGKERRRASTSASSRRRRTARR